MHRERKKETRGGDQLHGPGPQTGGGPGPFLRFCPVKKRTQEESKEGKKKNQRSQTKTQKRVCHTKSPLSSTYQGLHLQALNFL